MPDVPSSIPRELVAGDTWAWTRDLGDYPASTWTATAYFENKDGVFQAAGVADGDTHTFTIAAATTTTVKPGRYGWRLRVTDGTTTTTVENGISEVLVDPAKAGKVDTRSWARRTLEALEEFLETNAATSQATFSIGGRSVARWQISELTKWRKELQQEVKAEDLGANAASGRNIKVRYGRP